KPQSHRTDRRSVTVSERLCSGRVPPQERASGRKIQVVPTENPLACCAIVRASGKEAHASMHIGDRQGAAGCPMDMRMDTSRDDRKRTFLATVRHASYDWDLNGPQDSGFQTDIEGSASTGSGFGMFSL